MTILKETSARTHKSPHVVADTAHYEHVFELFTSRSHLLNVIVTVQREQGDFLRWQTDSE